MRDLHLYSQFSLQHVDQQVIYLLVPDEVKGHGSEVSRGTKVVVIVKVVYVLEHSVGHLYKKQIFIRMIMVKFQNDNYMCEVTEISGSVRQLVRILKTHSALRY